MPAAARRLLLAALLAILALPASAGAARLKLRSISLPPGTASQVAPGPGGTMWMTSDGAGNYVARVSRAGKLMTFPIPTPAAGPDGIVRGPDGNMWFSEREASKIARITPAGAITEFPAPPGSKPRGITVGPDGNLWFAEFGTGRIGRMSTAGVLLNEFPIGDGSQTISIATGPDHNLWFTAGGFDSVGRITLGGAMTLFGAAFRSGPEWIARGPDRALWFTEDDGNRVGRVSTSGEVREFQSGITPRSVPERIVAGPDGGLWFTELIGGRVARITTSGVVQQFNVGKTAKPWGIAAGPGGTIWFAQAAANKLTRFKPPILPPPASSVSYDFSAQGGRTTFRTLLVKGIPRGGRVEARCSGGGCATRRVTVRGHRRVNLRPRFRRPLSAGATLTIRVFAPGLSTKVDVFKVRAGGPKRSTRCSPPGKRKLVRCVS